VKFKAETKIWLLIRAYERGVLGALPVQRLARLAVFCAVKENMDKNDGSRSFCGFVYDDD
jgi:hypothetical protein